MKGNIVRKVNFNTNNAWGFGGSAGTDTYYDNDVIVRKARNYHRHSGTSSDNRIMVIVNEDGFSITVREKMPKDADEIRVFEYDGHYHATFKKVDNFSQYGWDYKLVKTIKI